MDRALAPNLRISFPAPGFFLSDARLVILLNGHVLFAGSFVQGVDFMVPVTPGNHVVSTRIELGLFTRARDYPVMIPAGQAYSVVLEYSRFWGNFTKKPRIIGHG